MHGTGRICDKYARVSGRCAVPRETSRAIPRLGILNAGNLCGFSVCPGNYRVAI